MDYQEIKACNKIPQLAKLLDLSTPPKHLYYIGKLDLEIFNDCTAIVGSRKMTCYGARVVDKIIPPLVAQKETIVSGFMYGVDQYAHIQTVENGGKTIAVLGWGINNPLSKEDLRLANKIIDSGGILISEWESQKPTHWTFPARNRIVAALSKQVIVVEAAQNSGSLITARIASRLKRKLFAVPGPVTSRTSEGTNGLISSGRAQMYLTNQTPVLPLQTDNPILLALDNESLTTDELSRKLELAVSDIGAQLSLLMLSGQIMEKDGKYYINEEQ